MPTRIRQRRPHTAARHHASGLQSAAHEQRDIVLANVVASCVDDLQRVIELRQF